MTVLVVSSISKYFVYVRVSSQLSKNDSMSLANSNLLNKVLIEILNLLGLPELLDKHVLVPISDTAAAESIKAPLIKITIICNSRSMVLMNVNIDKLDGISIISNSAKNRLSLDILPTSKCTLTIVAGRP